MTTEEMDRAIAEAVGWSDLRKGPYDGGYHGRYKDHTLRPIPRYSADLNAMHEAEKTLRKNQFHFVHYTRELWKLEAGDVEYGNLGYFGFNFVTMDANRRAEAFVRTIGKWRIE